MWGKWLRRNLPNARLIPVTSTAEAVRESAEGEGIAAIAGKLAREAHGVPMLDSGIQDRKDNVTRFLVVSRNPSAKREGYLIVRVVLFLPDQVGALQSPPSIHFPHAGSIYVRSSRVRVSGKPGIIFSLSISSVMRRTRIFARH